MDSQGNIISALQMEELRKLEPKLAARMVPIPDEEVERLKAATVEARKDWYRTQTKAQRKRRRKEARERA